MQKFSPQRFSTSTFLALLGLETRRNARMRTLLTTGLVLSGVAVGALSALFFAPKAGREFRHDVASRGRRLVSRTAHTAPAGRVEANAGTLTPAGLASIPEGTTGI